MHNQPPRSEPTIAIGHPRAKSNHAIAMWHIGRYLPRAHLFQFLSPDTSAVSFRESIFYVERELVCVDCDCIKQ